MGSYTALEIAEINAVILQKKPYKDVHIETTAIEISRKRRV